VGSESSPNTISYDDLLRVLFERSVTGMSDEDLVYFLELVQSLKEHKEKTDTEAWWNRYYH